MKRRTASWTPGRSNIKKLESLSSNKDKEKGLRMEVEKSHGLEAAKSASEFGGLEASILTASTGSAGLPPDTLRSASRFGILGIGRLNDHSNQGEEKN